MLIQVVKLKIHGLKVSLLDTLFLITYAFIDIEKAKPTLFPNENLTLLNH